MSVDKSTSLIERKARSGRDTAAARAMSLARALRLTAAKQADQMMDLALSVLSVTRKPVERDGIGSILDEQSLILIMDGPGTQVALAVFEPMLVTGLIQQQTMGKVTRAQAGTAPRKHTATDAALCAPFVEALFSHGALLPEKDEDRTLIRGYRFGVWAEVPRLAELAIEGDSFELIDMTLDLAGGARAGKLTLILPEPAVIAPESPAAEAGEPEQAVTPSAAMSEIVLDLHADLHVALTRLKMPLQAVIALKVGDVIELKAANFGKALVLDPNGRAISRGALGQIDGMRALQVERNVKAGLSPKRRASDRAELDLPDVMGARAAATTSVPALPGFVADAEREIPRASDVDIFGDIDALPDMPDFDEDGDLADLSSLPDLDALPDLPDLDGPGDRDSDLSFDLPDFDVQQAG